MRPYLLIFLALASCARKPVEQDAVTLFIVPTRAAASDPRPDQVNEPVPEPAPDPPAEPAGPVVPVENQEKNVPPDAASAEEGARLLFEAIKKDDPALAEEFFFPAAAFDLVKNMDDASNYHRKLETYYEEDVHAEHGRYFGVKAMEFDSFELGGCTWKEPLTQGNKLPYWSCRNSRIIVRTGTKKFDYRIRALINWGSKWYVIHLGPIRS
ncbi:MAG: hypothetical protein JRG91_11215 [Deltaproteobacteria bacterium]|nr:hypothetical protein [Deltaproteobacteria bacterium]